MEVSDRTAFFSLSIKYGTILPSWVMNPSTTVTLGTEEIGRFRVAVRGDSTAVPKKAIEGKRKGIKTISLSNFPFTKCLIQTDRIDIRASAESKVWHSKLGIRDFLMGWWWSQYYTLHEPPVSGHSANCQAARSLLKVFLGVERTNNTGRSFDSHTQLLRQNSCPAWRALSGKMREYVVKSDASILWSD